MKKNIFLGLMLIISTANTFIVHEVKTVEKIRQLFQEFSNLKNPVSLTAEIVFRHLKSEINSFKKGYYKLDG
jgi:hypothetical protein